MFLEDYDSSRDQDVEQGSGNRPVVDPPRSSDFAVEPAAANSVRRSAPGVRVAEQASTISELEADVSPSKDRARKPRLSARWWLFAAGAALVLILLSVAGVYLLTKGSSTVDNIVITTVPSGAEIKLDSTAYGLSPVKLEQVAKGTYTLTITKESFEPIVVPITLSDSRHQFDYKLKPLPPPELVGLSQEDLIKFYQGKLDEALAQGHYGIPYKDSAHYYTDLIISLDSTNDFAIKRQEEIRALAERLAKEAIARGDLAQAQEINRFIREYYNQKDEATRRTVNELEGQLYSQNERLSDLLRKARESLASSDPATAYAYTKQAFEIDRQNTEARRIRESIKESYFASIKQAYESGNVDEASQKRDQFLKLFPEDKQLRARLRDLDTFARAEQAKINDPTERREQGLAKYLKGQYADAINDLESAMFGGRSEPEVIFALARSCQMVGQLDKAESYYSSVKPSDDDTYRSAIAALGDIAKQRGNTAAALEKYKQARQLGGSALYTIPALDNKIEEIEKRQREKAAEPVPLTIQVRHQHGGLGGSCRGSLGVSSTGVRYDGSEDQFSWNLISVGVQVKGTELTISVQGKRERFKVDNSLAERFRETVTRYQTANKPGNQ
jgi:predicted negative regulator of RcsB-dependent stress response